MKTIDVVAAILVVVGAINWGLVGLFDFNLVQYVLGTGSPARFVYILVGIAGAFQAVQWAAIQRRWSHDSPHTPPTV